MELQKKMQKARFSIKSCIVFYALLIFFYTFRWDCEYVKWIFLFLYISNFQTLRYIQLDDTKLDKFPSSIISTTFSFLPTHFRLPFWLYSFLLFDICPSRAESSPSTNSTARSATTLSLIFSLSLETFLLCCECPSTPSEFIFVLSLPPFRRSIISNKWSVGTCVFQRHRHRHRRPFVRAYVCD